MTGELSGIGIGEIVGIGTVSLAVIYGGIAVIRMLIKVIERNAEAMEKLSNNVSANTAATKELKDQSASTKGAMDRFTETLIQSQLRKP